MGDNENSNLVWHYTDGAALMNIITNNELWASSAAFMNDVDELLSGNKELRKHFDEQRETLPEPVAQLLEQHIPKEDSRTKDAFVLSGSTDPDSLTLWRNYGRHQVSFAVGFDKRVPLVPMIPTVPKDGIEVTEHPYPPSDYYENMYDSDAEGNVALHPDGSPIVINDPDTERVENSGWKPVVYDQSQQKDLISEIFARLRQSAEAATDGKSSIGFWMQLYLMNESLHLIKNAGFLDEKEERVVVWLAPDWKFVCHRPGPYGIMPYIKLTAPSEDDSDHRYATKPGTLPIQEIRVGPSPYSLAAVESLKQLLGFHGLHDVKVTYSEIPFR
ncbi:hypothetical protein [Arthrobacter glacialis]|uniref:DUF2971 domain-containing protein n=1 Tax=Arthrobacter glacialis TaxID=1664 RepID=A0A2S4A224_ARTGL|nr:hypothetical protein [Arthrobacter glacialis]POH75369.1 hypothetical protein CVS27_01850 [Arthrobacter glacialis]